MQGGVKHLVMLNHSGTHHARSIQSDSVRPGRAEGRSPEEVGWGERAARGEKQEAGGWGMGRYRSTSEVGAGRGRGHKPVGVSDVNIFEMRY